MMEAVSAWEDDYAQRLVNGGFQMRQSSVNDILPSNNTIQGRRAWRRFHVRGHGISAEEDRSEKVRMVRRHGRGVPGMESETCTKYCTEA